MRCLRLDVQDSKTGLTLLEMLLCLALLGILSVVGVSTIRGLIPSARVNRAVREAAALLEWARWRAVEEGTVFRVDFDTDAERMTVTREAIGEGAVPKEETVKTLDLRSAHPGIVLGAPTSTFRTSGCNYVDGSGIHFRDHLLRFLPTGTSDRCGSLYLVPESDLPEGREHLAALSLLLGTGRVQLWRYDPIDVSTCSHAGVWSPSL